MPDARAFLAINNTLWRLCHRFGTDEVLVNVKAWVEYIERVKAVRFLVPDDVDGLLQAADRKETS